MGVLSDDDLVRMRARARHRLFGALALVVLMVVGVPLLFDRQEAPPPAASDDSEGDHPGAPSPTPQPSTVSAPGAGADHADTAATQVAGTAPATEAPANSPGKPPAAPAADAGSPPAPATGSTAGPPAPADAGAAHPTPAAGADAHVAGPDTIPPLTVAAPGRHGTAGTPGSGAGRSATGKAAQAPSAEAAARVSAAKDAAVRESAAREAAAHAKAGSPSAPSPPAAASAAAAPTAPASGAAATDSTAADTPAAPHGWFVQFGMFAEPARAQALSQQLEAKGIRVHDEVVHGPRGRFTLVRAGPFGSREAADELLAHARSLGENAFLGHQ